MACRSRCTVGGASGDPPRLLPRAGGPRSARAGWGKSGVRVQPDEQPGGRDTQDLGEMEQRQDRNIALPQFDIADIRPTYAGASRKGLLGQAALFAVLTEGGSKTLQRCVVGT